MVSIIELLRMPTGIYCVLLSDYRIVEEATMSNEATTKKLEQALKEKEIALKEKKMWMERAIDAQTLLEKASGGQAT